MDETSAVQVGGSNALDRGQRVDRHARGPPPGAPVSDWRQVAAFAREAPREEARQRRTGEVIECARAAVGEDAKCDPDVRRAVNARCVAAPR